MLKKFGVIMWLFFNFLLTFYLFCDITNWPFTFENTVKCFFFVLLCIVWLIFAIVIAVGIAISCFTEEEE